VLELGPIAVIEEAQSVLQGRTASEPFLAWVKEGRKYDLGALLVTQQPGSIPVEILSQGDNWFVFHLLASADLVNLQRANAHFSDDILAALLNEPIPGHGAFWSSVGGSPYPVPIRVLSFEALYRVRDPEYTRERVPTFARELRAEFEQVLRDFGIASAEPEEPDRVAGGSAPEGVDLLLAIEEQVMIRALQADTRAMNRLQNAGMAWGSVKAIFLAELPPALTDRDDLAYRLVPKALNRLFGPEGWESFKHPQKGTTWVRALSTPEP